LIVTDPDGITITPNTIIHTGEEVLTEVPGQLYYSIYDMDADGTPKTEVYWPQFKTGNYLIRPLKRTDASVGSVYSLTIVTNAGSKVIANNVSVDDIPATGYGITVTETGLTSFVPTEVVPLISGETADATTASSVTINWKTDNPATSRVVYDTIPHIVQDAGPNYGYAYSTPENSALTTNHSVVVTGLTPNTPYFFRAVSHGSPEVISNEIAVSTAIQSYGTLVVTKNTLGGDGTFSFAGDAGIFSITTSGGTATTTIENLVPGSYSINEDPALGWTATGNDCTSMSVNAGETSACTITNAKKGNIVIKKVATGGTGSFTFTASYNPDGFSINGGGQNDSGLLDPGEYAVSENTPDGWTLTSAICSDGSDPSTINLDPGETVTCTFTNIKQTQKNKGVISGIKFEDVNGNGIKDSGDRGLAGWVIYLDANNNGKWNRGERFAVTNRRGEYRFGQLPAGSYTVRELTRKGWTQTYPADGKQTIVLTAGQSITSKDFGNFKQGVISGMKFEDKNGNGRKDRNESGLKNWTIKLKYPNGTFATAITDRNGKYKFTGLGPGVYEVTEVQQRGWTQKTVNPVPINITSGKASDGNNFGNKKDDSCSK